MPVICLSSLAAERSHMDSRVVESCTTASVKFGVVPAKAGTHNP